MISMWLALAPTAAAHARLDTSSIAPGAILPAVPELISLTFTESIDPDFSSASLIKPDRSFASAVTISLDPADGNTGNFTIESAADLPAGSYALLWRVVSAVDGHTTTGVLGFSAGTGAAPEIASTSEASGGNWSGTIGRWLELIGFMAIAGAALLAIIASDPARVFRQLTAWALPIIGIGLMITLLALLANASGDQFGSWPGVTRGLEILRDSTPGRALLLRIAAFAALGLVVAIGHRLGRAQQRLTLLASGIALGTYPFIGHAAGLRGNTAVAFDLLHLFSAAIWGGGVLLVAATLWKRDDAARADDVVRLVSRFSALAAIAFGIMLVSGIVSAGFNVAGPKNLTGEEYGRALILKVILALLILTTAAVNRLMIVPQLRREDSVTGASPARTLRHATWIELGFAIAVLLLAARLTSIPPADAPLTVEVANRAGPIARAATSNDLAFALTGNLVNDADATIRMEVTDAATGAPAVDLARVIVDARAPDPLDPDGEPIQDRFDATPVAGEPGVYEVPRSRLGLEAEWQIEIIARRIGLADEAASFTLDLTSTAPQPPRLVQESWKLPRMPWSGYLALLAAAATVVGSLFLIRRLKGLEPITAGIMLSVAAMITLGFLLSAWRSGPIPIDATALSATANLDDPAAIQRAGSTWAMQCAACHGVDGGGTGDTPAENQGGHVHPSVAGDLLGPQSQARTPAELYWIITNGLGGTTMPAFDLALTDQERLDLVARLRWLQAAADGD